MSLIRILPEAVANKIAAGEVVERPASVVKELIENSLDGGAGRVEAAVEAGGKRLIRVSDDGWGMSHDDALLAFERHATSKIRTADDLIEITTLGFRGEALPSIAAVSRLVLETRHASESSGTRVEIAGSRLCDVSEVAWPGGTQVEVRELFFNTPARRKFLKSESTELAHIATLVTHYALAHPEKSFRLTSLTNELVNCSPVATHRERVYQLLGGQLLEQMLEIAPAERRMPTAMAGAPDEEEPEPQEALIARMTGFASRPEVQKLNRNQIYFFVNRRLVRDRLILHAISEAYRNILPPNIFPVALIFLELPAREVDVNVHPSKIEVRFRHSAFIHDFVRDTIRQTLVAARPIAAFPLPRAKPPSGTGLEEAEVAERLAEEPPTLRGAAVPPVVRKPSAATAARADDLLLSSPKPPPRTETLPLAEAAVSMYAPSRADQRVAEPLHGELISPGEGEFPADLEPLGQVQDSFVVAANSDGLWIVDQHAAHERILFERHRRLRREKSVEGQRLLMPIVVELKPDQQAIFREIADELMANGFEVEPFGQRTVAVKTAPADIHAEDVEKLLIEILDGVAREERAVTLEALRAKIAASVSCHAAVKANMAMDRSKMQWLLRELGKTECPMSCPHGRPIVLRYGLREIHKAFKRI